MGGPAFDRLHDPPAIGERAIRRLASGISDEMRVASRVGEIIQTIMLEHSRAFEKAPLGVAGQ